MRKLNYYLGALAFAAIGFTSCSSDDIVDDKAYLDTSVDRTIYVNLAIHADAAGGSRASGTDGNPDDTYTNGDGEYTDFSAGTADESKVSTVYVVFYDNDGNVVGQVTQIELDGTDQFQPVANGTSVESQLKKVVPVQLQQGQANPSQVMCYINPINTSSLQNPLYTMQTVTRDAVYTNISETEKIFPMSNSVYYGADGNLMIGVPVPVTAIFGSMEEANTALNPGEGLQPQDSKIIDIYVERYACKLSLDLTKATTEPYKTACLSYETKANGDGTYTTTTSEVPVVLTFVPTGWAVNGESKRTFIVKSFREASTTGQILPNNFAFDAINKNINSENIEYDGTTITASGALSNWNWNNPAYHRSYWAMSPVYFQSEYPEVLSDYNAAESNQLFISYDQIVGNTVPKLGFSPNDNTAHYFKETTSGYPALRSKNPNAAIVSATVVGQYNLQVGDNESISAPTFYTYLNTNPNGIGNGNASIYFEATGPDDTKSAVTGGTSMKERFIRQATVLYKNTAEAGVDPVYVRMSANNPEDLAKIAELTEIATPTTEVLTTTTTTTTGEGENQTTSTVTNVTKFASSSRTLQIETNATLTGLYINANGVPKQIVADGAVTNEAQEISLTDANRILWQNVGTCVQYTKGTGFYDIPVKHLGWYRAGNQQRLGTGAIDFNKVRLGDLGMVRNHSYSIVIDKITGLASGIAGLDQPIIPPADTKEVYMAYRINILKWAVVPTQNVTLE